MIIFLITPISLLALQDALYLHTSFRASNRFFELHSLFVFCSISYCAIVIDRFTPSIAFLLSSTANQTGQYQQQDGQMIYGVPNQQEGVNPLGDPLQVD